MSQWKNQAEPIGIATEITVALDELVNELSGLDYQRSYAKMPTEAEVEQLRSGSDESRVMAAMRLNRIYRDGYTASAKIAGFCHYVYVVNGAGKTVPMVADVLRVMGYGLTQSEAVYALGGTD